MRLCRSSPYQRGAIQLNPLNTASLPGVCMSAHAYDMARPRLVPVVVGG